MVKRKTRQPMVKLTLRRVVFDVDFRQSETTMWDSLPKSFRKKLAAHDAVCFVNTKKTLLRVVIAPEYGAAGITSVQHRYTGNRRFSALTLQNVAHDELGIHFENLRLFEEHFPDLAKFAE